MSREIKFRAWHQTFGPYSKGIMHYFSLQDLFENEDHEGDLFTAQGILDLESLKKNPLMQYTGLKDARGKEIYEGDIVSYRGYRGVVKISPLKGAHISSYHPECAAFEDGKEYKLEEGMRGERTGCPVGVIGNIYENPELWEAK